MSTDPSVRRILPQDAHTAQTAQMSSFQFAPQQFPQRETQKSQYLRLPALRDLPNCRKRCGTLPGRLTYG